MLHIPLGLVLAAVPTTAVPEIDSTNHPPAGQLLSAYKVLMTIEFASGEVEAIPIAFASSEGADDAADAFFRVARGDEWVSWRKGLKVYIAAGGGSPVTKLTIESTGPQPVDRWWPMARRKK
ncbi:MAG: hypothetical protein K2X87_29800 [Gemmataceae bacterium]|nr:hypothetical protein [Gemmataceae bacterium]